MGVKNVNVNAMKIGAHEMLGEVCTFGFGSSVKKAFPSLEFSCIGECKAVLWTTLPVCYNTFFRQRWISITIYKAAQSSLHFYTGFNELFTYLD